jgi:hypothetical protein
VLGKGEGKGAEEGLGLLASWGTRSSSSASLIVRTPPRMITYLGINGEWA